MTTCVWADGTYARHAFKNALAGFPSLCGIAKFPEGPCEDSTLQPCTWCASKTRPPGGETTGGAHERGVHWAQSKMVVNGRRNWKGYNH